MDQDTGSHHARKPSYFRYGIVLVLLAVVRVLELATAGSALRARAYYSTSGLIGACLLSGVACFFVSRMARRYFSPGVSLLLSVLTGAAITTVVSSIPGMVVGFVIGTLAVFETPRRYSWKIFRFSGLSIFPGASCGFVLGLFGSWSTVICVEAGRDRGVALTVCGVLLGLAILWTLLVAWFRPGYRLLMAVVVFPLFFAFAISSVPFGIRADTERRLTLLSRQQVDLWPEQVPLGYMWWTHGFVTPTAVTVSPRLSDEQVRLMLPFREITDVGFQDGGSAVSTSGLSRLDFRNVTSVVSYSAQFDDQALSAFAKSRQLASLWCVESSITDRGLEALAQMRPLRVINLRNCEVDGSGFRHLHPGCLLEHVALEGTNVDDQGLAHLSGRPIKYLDLRGTRVTGEGLSGFASRSNPNPDGPFVLPGLGRLDLSNSSFSEEHVGQIPDTVTHLHLDGSKLSANGAQRLAERFGKPRSFEVLSLVNTGIDDNAVSHLRRVVVNELRIDATELTVASCEALAQSSSIEFVYQWPEWSRSGRSLDDLLGHFHECESELLRIKAERSIPLPTHGPPAVSLSIQHLPVRAEMVKSLVHMHEGKLYDASVSGVREVPSELHMNELGRFFPQEILPYEHAFADPAESD